MISSIISSRLAIIASLSSLLLFALFLSRNARTARIGCLHGHRCHRREERLEWYSARLQSIRVAVRDLRRMGWRSELRIVPKGWVSSAIKPTRLFLGRWISFGESFWIPRDIAIAWLSLIDIFLETRLFLRERLLVLPHFPFSLWTLAVTVVNLALTLLRIRFVFLAAHLAH